MRKFNLKEAAHIAVSGYGPCSYWTLEEWLHCRELFRKNEKAALTAVNVPKDIMK